MNFYTGVGSRETPADVLETMLALGRMFARTGWTLRSGAALGADSAFESGCDLAHGPKDIYLPWKNYNGHGSEQHDVGRLAMQTAESIHPVWLKLSEASRRLHARNVYQVLGREMDLPSRLLICWTADACENEQERTKKTGGTGTAIVLADRHGVPVFNLAKDGCYARLLEFLKAEL